MAYLYDSDMDMTECPHIDIVIEDDGPSDTMAVCTECHSYGPVIEELYWERNKNI